MVRQRQTDKAILSDEKLAQLQEILATVGLDDPDHWGFSHHVRDPESYTGGSLEWSERGKNMRYYFWAYPGQPMTKVDVFILDGRSRHDLYSNEVIAEANRRLAELFKD